MAKMDVKSAFRLIPVRPAEWNLLGYQWNGEFYFDVVLPFGCRASPYVFEQFAGAVHWIVSNRTGLVSMLHYVDDYFFAGKPGSNQCGTLMSTMTQTCSELGVPLAHDKTEGPATQLTFLGIRLDFVRQTLSLPDDKRQIIEEALEEWSNCDHCTKQQLQSLIGTLTFATKCVPASRLFTRRMIALLTDNYHERLIALNGEFRKDLEWWKEFLPAWNGTASFIQPDWTRSDVLDLYTDASGTLGRGAYFHGSWFQLRWPPWIIQRKPCIEYLELIPILLSLIVWGSKLQRKRVIFHCDNEGATLAWENLRSTNFGVLDLMRRMLKAAACANMAFTIKHIRGVNNAIADSLSRFQRSRFRALAPTASERPDPCPDIFPQLLIAYSAHTA
ncbi:uncharacterized protein LOC129587950 [Paramacrobiotus metropolitanus]|uniref:uncharacterized protein LOC129587950 n=1 Tax=Paramacrobiotus metropolitanus TaxID=2943436 RepID=UPI0024456764|nr:uncharacterized protein LOC129587950 [Paramacrobiotus metropolitanus]